MKRFVLSLLISVCASSAFAGSMICTEMTDSNPKVMTIQARGNTNVPENSPVPYFIELMDGENVLFSGMVTGRQEDVNLSLTSPHRARPRLSVRVYLDELDQTSVTLNGRRLSGRFDCGL